MAVVAEVVAVAVAEVAAADGEEEVVEVVEEEVTGDLGEEFEMGKMEMAYKLV